MNDNSFALVNLYLIAMNNDVSELNKFICLNPGLKLLLNRDFVGFRKKFVTKVLLKTDLSGKSDFRDSAILDLLNTKNGDLK